MKKLFCVVLAAGMALGLLSGCEGTGNSGKSSNFKPVDGSVSKAYTFKKFDPPITLTTDRYIKPGDDPNDFDTNAHNVWAKETLGIIWKTKFTAATDSDALTQLTLLAQSDDLPDVMCNAYPILDYLYGAGQIAVMQDEIEKYGSPAVKYLWLEEYPKVTNGMGLYNFKNEEGKFYALPIVPDPLAANAFERVGIREDIVDELGYDMPETLAELEEIFAAYKAKNPNNISMFAEGWMFGSMSMIYNAMNAYPRRWIERDGKLTYGGTQPEVKNALSMLRSWYSKGYIDKDFDKGNYDSEFAKFLNGQSLTIGGATWIYHNKGPELAEKNASAVMSPVPYLKDAEGKTPAYITTVGTGWPAAISKNCANREAVITELNAVVDSGMRNELDLREKFGSNYPITKPQFPLNPDEVAAADLKVAKFDYKPNEIGPGFFNKGFFKSSGIGWGTATTRPSAYSGKAQKMYDVFNECDGNVKETVEKLPKAEATMFMEAYVNSIETKGNAMAIRASLKNYAYNSAAMAGGYVIFDPFTDNIHTDIIDQFFPTLEAMERQTHIDIIKGVKPLDDFDKFVTSWMDSGGKKMLDEADKYYQSKKK